MDPNDKGTAEWAYNSLSSVVAREGSKGSEII